LQEMQGNGAARVECLAREVGMRNVEVKRVGGGRRSVLGSWFLVLGCEG
jgi:hypothetical protein